MNLEQKIRKLQGPILVLGASGFAGANLLRQLLNCREDVFGTASRFPAWRLEGLPENNVIAVDLLVDSNLDFLLEKTQPRTILPLEPIPLKPTFRTSVCNIKSYKQG